MQVETERLRTLRDEFEKEITSRLEGITIHGLKAPRLANTSSMRFKNVAAETLIANLEQKGICVSTGSACMSGSSEPSHVLKAMGISEEEALSAVRFSFGRVNRKEDTQLLIHEIKSVVERLRKKEMAGAL